MALDWQLIQVPLAAGLNQKPDVRALPPPGLLRAVDVQSEEPGGLQTRYPYGAAMSNIFGGGTLSNCRRVVPNGDELLVFTKDTLYSLNAQLTKFVSKGTHLAVRVNERTAGSTTDDQFDCDRAELSGTIVTCWTVSSSNDTVVTLYVRAEDKTTGAVIVTPTSIASACRPRLVALSTKILLFYASSSDGGATFTALKVLALDPADVATGLAAAATSILAANVGGPYDVMKIPGADTAIGAAQRNPSTSYEVFKVTAAVSVSQSTKARTCDGPIAVSVEPTGTNVQVIRADGTNIKGDFLVVSSLADSTTAQAVGTAAGTPVNQIAAAHRSTQDSGQYRCYVFWSAQEAATSTGYLLKYNYVDTGGTIGTQATFIQRLGVASRAFDYDGHVYFWAVFAGESAAAGMGEPLGIRAQLQNTYFLYRDDGHWATMSAFDRAGGFAPSSGRLPGVALTSGTTTYSWCGTTRRLIPLGTDHRGYADREPVDITFTFDSNDARRVVRMGNTLYVTGGMILQYDGVGLVELGFPIYPWVFGSVVVGAGQVDAGKHSYKSTYRWQNAMGEQERSTTATGEQPNVGASQYVQLATVPLSVTRKTSPRSEVSIEFWRTVKDPTDTSDYYLVTDRDPTVTTGNNCYIANAPTGSISTFSDNFTDATLLTKEPNPENGSVLEFLCPPGGSVIASTDVRMFISALTSEPNRVVYSRTRSADEIVSFHDQLAFDVPRRGGDVTAIRFLNETVVVFRETACYAFSGDGYANDGTGTNFGLATSNNLDVGRQLSLDVGAVSDDACCQFPDGILFKSSKGWYVLDRGWNVKYVGGKVSDYDSETVLSIDVMETQHQIRVLSASRMLVFDYLLNEWFEWSISDGVHSCVWNGAHVYLTSTGPKQQATTYSGINYGLDVETAWVKLNDLQGFGALRKILLLGEQGDTDTAVRFRVYRDYKTTPIYDRVYQQLNNVLGNPLQLKFGQFMQCEAIKVRITVTGGTGDGAVAAGMLTSVGGNWSAGSTVATNSTVWNALLQARNTGTEGNSYTFSVYTTQGPAICECRDNQRFDGSNWSAVANNIGVRVGDGCTVAQLEAALAGSRLIQVTTPDASPTKVISDTNTSHTSNVFTSGAVAAPNGTPPKLTGIALEVGIKSGAFKRLPATQRI